MVSKYFEKILFARNFDQVDRVLFVADGLIASLVPAGSALSVMTHI